MKICSPESRAGESRFHGFEIADARPRVRPQAVLTRARDHLRFEQLSPALPPAQSPEYRKADEQQKGSSLNTKSDYIRAQEQVRMDNVLE